MSTAQRKARTPFQTRVAGALACIKFINSTSATAGPDDLPPTDEHPLDDEELYRALASRAPVASPQLRHRDVAAVEVSKPLRMSIEELRYVQRNLAAMEAEVDNSLAQTEAHLRASGDDIAALQADLRVVMRQNHIPLDAPPPSLLSAKSIFGISFRLSRPSSVASQPPVSPPHFDPPPQEIGALPINRAVLPTLKLPTLSQSPPPRRFKRFEPTEYVKRRERRTRAESPPPRPSEPQPDRALWLIDARRPRTVADMRRRGSEVESPAGGGGGDAMGELLRSVADERRGAVAKVMRAIARGGRTSHVLADAGEAYFKTTERPPPFLKKLIKPRRAVSPSQEGGGVRPWSSVETVPTVEEGRVTIGA
jgi:hypothetical protein